MIEVLFYAAAGAAGGFIRSIITGKGNIALPKIQTVEGGSRHLNLGFLAPIAIGAFAGWLAPVTLGINSIVSAIAGYASTDFIENMAERSIRGTPGSWRKQ